MRYCANDIESWAAEYADAPDVQRLVGLVEADRNLPQPSTLRPGSPERQLAEVRQARLLKLAAHLGYKPPIKELVTTIAAETVKSTLLGATGLAETSVGETLDRLPAPERASRAEREEEQAEKRRKRALFGPDLERTL